MLQRVSSRSESVPVLSVAEFEQEIARDQAFIQHQPVIVEGFIDRWPASTEWLDHQHLRARFGHVPVRASAPQFPTFLGQDICSVGTTFGDYLSYLENPDLADQLFAGQWMQGGPDQLRAMDSPLYCGSLRFVSSPEEARIPELSPLLPEGVECWNDMIPHFYKLENHFWLFVAKAGALTPLHTDNNAVIAYLAQFSGEKDLTLFGPEDHDLLYRSDHGYLDWDRPDSALFPDWPAARRWSTRIRPGQLMFIGTGWAHHVRTLQDSVTFSFEFINRSNVNAFVDCGEWLVDLGRFALAQGGSADSPPAERSLAAGRSLMRGLLRRRLAQESLSAKERDVQAKLLARIEALPA